MIEAEKIAEAYNKHKAKLTQREEDVVTRFYGIGNEVRHSLRELGEKYQVTRERIRQIKVDALTKIEIKN